MNQNLITTSSLPISNNSEILLPTDYGLDALAAILHEAAVEKGFWDSPEDPNAFNTKLDYINGEIIEIREGIKNNAYSEDMVACMVMILIRTLDLYAAMRNAGMLEDSVDELLVRQIENNKAIIAALHSNSN